MIVLADFLLMKKKKEFRLFHNEKIIVQFSEKNLSTQSLVHSRFFFLMNGDFFLMNGDFFLMNGDFFLMNGDFLLMNGDFFLMNGDFFLMNGDFF